MKRRKELDTSAGNRRLDSLQLIILISASLLLTSCFYQPQTSHYAKPTTDFSKIKKIAVTRFESREPSVGQEVADVMAISFLKAGYGAVERSQLKYIIDENRLSQTGLTDDNKKALKLAGIEALVMGSVGKYDCVSDREAVAYGQIAIASTLSNCQASLSIKMVDVNSGDVIWTGQGSHALKAQNMTAGRVMQTVISDIEKSIPSCESSQPEFASPNSKKTDSSKSYKREAIDWTEKGEQNIEKKNWSEVIRAASAAITIDPSYPGAYIIRSWAYLEKGFPEESIADSQKALELDSGNVAALNNRGLFYLRTSKPDLAKGDFEIACNKGLEVSCNNFKLITGYKPSEKTDYFLKKTNEALDKKNWDAVIQYTSEIVENDLALSARCEAYANKGLITEAIADCDKAIKMNPNLARAYNNKGYSLEMSGKKKEAALNYEFACNLNLSLGCANLKRLTPLINK